MHPLAAPGTLWVLSRVGKYLVRPQADETSHKKQISCGRQGKRASLLFSVLQRVSPLRRRPGGFPLAPWTPSGPILICVGKTSHEKQTSCGRQEKALPFFFPYRKGFRLCGGDQRAFRSPFGNLRALAAKGWRKKTDSLWMARKSPSLLLPVLRRVSPLRRRPGGFPVAP